MNHDEKVRLALSDMLTARGKLEAARVECLQKTKEARRILKSAYGCPSSTLFRGIIYSLTPDETEEDMVMEETKFSGRVI